MEERHLREVAEALESAGKYAGASVIGAVLFSFVAVFLLGGF